MDEDTLMRKWARGPFRLELHELPGPQPYRCDPDGYTSIGYCFYHDGQLIFEGNSDVPPDQSLDGDQTVRAVLHFLARRPGDVEPEYFADYTRTQLDWRDQHAEDLELVLDEWPLQPRR